MGFQPNGVRRMGKERFFGGGFEFLVSSFEGGNASYISCFFWKFLGVKWFGLSSKF